MATRKPSARQRDAQFILKLILIPVALFWALEAVDVALKVSTDIYLDRWGIVPRELVGLRGLIFSPFLHGDFGHVAANTVPFIILGGMIAFHRVSDFIWASVIIAIVGGLGVWLVGAENSVHIGASGVVFGYFGFLIGSGIFERNRWTIIRALAVIMLYGYFIWGVLPQGPGISWEGHLFGALAGVFAAWLLARK